MPRRPNRQRRGAVTKSLAGSNRASAPSDPEARPVGEQCDSPHNSRDWGFPRVPARVILRITRRKDPVDLVVVREDMNDVVRQMVWRA
jgi:hypothetical protein